MIQEERRKAKIVQDAHKKPMETPSERILTVKGGSDCDGTYSI